MHYRHCGELNLYYQYTNIPFQNCYMTFFPTWSKKNKTLKSHLIFIILVYKLKENKVRKGPKKHTIQMCVMGYEVINVKEINPSTDVPD